MPGAGEDADETPKRRGRPTAPADERDAAKRVRDAAKEQREAAKEQREAAEEQRQAAKDERWAAKEERWAARDERLAAKEERWAARDERRAAREERRAARQRGAAGAGDEAVVGDLPEPPWWRSEERRSARSALSRDAIVDAALVVLDRHGLDGLSMRRVADELGTGAASLYWHVANKDQLVNVVLDRVVGEVPLPEPDPDRWEEQLREFARNGRAAFRRYGDLARATLGQVPVGPNLAEVIEWQLELLSRAGIPARPAAWFGDLFALFIGAQSFEDALREDGAEDQEAAAGAYLASLPPDRFPYLLAAGPELMEGGADERFEFGLDLLLSGLRALADAPDEPDAPGASDVPH
jgi:AcrR family transcriptional regulator